MTRNEILQTAKPILFNTEMVRAILDGRKTVTRRAVKPKSPKACGFYATFNSNGNFEDVYDYDENEAMFESPQARLHIGDYLYVRETWATEKSNICIGIKSGICPHKSCDTADGACFADEYIYKVDNLSRTDVKWSPSIHMPKAAARIFLRVMGVRVERLQDITNEQAIKEGFIDFDTEPAVVGFVETWDEMVKKSDLAECGWNANPWVWVIEFERVEVE